MRSARRIGIAAGIAAMVLLGVAMARAQPRADEGAVTRSSRTSLAVLLGGMLFGVIGLGIYGARRGSARALPDAAGIGWQRVDVTRVRVVVPPARRAAIQRALASRAARTGTRPRALARLLREACDELLACSDEWLYGDVASCRPMSPPIAAARYRALAEAARDAVREGTPGAGEGVLLVSLVVAAREEIPDALPGREGVTKVLGALARLPADAIVALEPTWSPSRLDGSASTLELEAVHPDLARLEPA